MSLSEYRQRNADHEYRMHNTTKYTHLMQLKHPSTHQQASMYIYTIVGGGGGALPTSPHPLNTCSHNTATRRPPHPSNTQQHTTTHNNRKKHTTTVHNSTRVHKTTNIPVVFIALILNGFEECNIITRGIGRGGPWKSRLFWAQMALASLVPFQGPKKSQFSGPTPSNAPRNDVALLKKNYVPRHKNDRYINSYYERLF
jgi:hypothetical protein